MRYAIGLLLLCSLCGCRGSAMYVHPAQRELEYNDLRRSGQWTARPVAGTLPQNGADPQDTFESGLLDGKPIDSCPLPVTAELLRRGQERFEIFCTPCHGQVGDGNGMVGQRGFPRPPSYHQDYLRGAPLGHFVYVMSGGYGRMFSYADRVPAADRWAIAAYIRALQMSQNAHGSDLSPQDLQQLGATP